MSGWLTGDDNGAVWEYIFSFSMRVIVIQPFTAARHLLWKGLEGVRNAHERYQRTRGAKTMKPWALDANVMGRSGLKA